MIDPAADSTLFFSDFGESVVIKLSGVTVKTITGLFDLEQQVVSPFESERVIGKPAVTLKTSDLVGIGSTHLLVIRGVEYKFDGKPRPDGNGLTLVTLAVKK